MTKLIISQSEKNALAAARKAGTSRTPIWGAIRWQYGVPASFKLAVTCARELYVKGTDPKQFLIADAAGRYSHTAVDRVVPVTATPIQESRFVVATPQDADNLESDWSRVSVGDLLYTLRDTQEGVDDGVSLPEGFPASATRDAVVVDSVAGMLYFRT